MSGRPTTAHVVAWADAVEAVGRRIGTRFARSEPRVRAVGYIRGLLSQTERKNGWQLAEYLGDPTPDGVQHLLARTDWDADAVREDLIDYVRGHLDDPTGVRSSMRPGSSRRERSRVAWLVSTRGRWDASRTPRSACSWRIGGSRAMR